MAGKNENNYYKMLAEMAECAGQAATKLKSILGEFSYDVLPKHMKELHEIESAGDNFKHRLVEKLAREFITPIDREDFLGIASEIDDVIDSVEDVLIRIYMFNIKNIRPEAFEFADITKKCCKEMLTMMHEFENYKKSATIKNHIIEINRLEEEGDRLYMDSVRKLYVEKGDTIDIVAWTEVYNRFEKCCDACEHVANLVENVIMKNS